MPSVTRFLAVVRLIQLINFSYYYLSYNVHWISQRSVLMTVSAKDDKTYRWNFLVWARLGQAEVLIESIIY